MNLSGIIAISGKPGLFKVVAQAKNSIIVESLIDNKRSPAYATDRISALEDISIYTYSEDKPLKEIFKAIYEKENGGECLSHKDSLDKLTKYLLVILPDYDAERVYSSDIKKLFQWYNLLHKSNNLILEEAEEAPKTKKASTEDKKPAKKVADDSADSVEEKPKAKKKTETATAAKKKPAAAAKGPAKATAKTSGAPKAKTSVQRKSGSN